MAEQNCDVNDSMVNDDYQYVEIKKEVVDEDEDIVESPPTEPSDLEKYIYKLEETLRLTQSEKEKMLKEVVEANTKCLQQSYQLNIEKENIRRLQIEIMKMKLTWHKRIKELNDNLAVYKAAIEELEQENENLKNGMPVASSSKNLKMVRRVQSENNVSTNGFHNDRSVKKDQMDSFIMEPAISIIEQENTFVQPNFQERPVVVNENGGFGNIMKNIVLNNYPKLVIGSQTPILQRKGVLKKGKTQRRMATKRRIWDKDMMRAAVYAVRNKKMGFKKAAKVYNVPKTTLQCYSKQPEENIEKVISRPIGRKTTLPTEIETELVEYSKKLDKIFYGLSTTDLRQIAFQIATKNDIKHPFSNDSSTAGRGWLRRFSNRHPEVTVKIHRPSAKYLEYNLKYVTKFYSNLKALLNTISSSPNRIFNVDESGLLITQRENHKSVFLKAEDEVIDHLLPEDIDGYLTLISCASASGTYVPPMLLYPTKIEPDMLEDATPGSISGYHVSGWVTDDLFITWFNHFLENVKPSKENPVILIVNGYTAHKCNIEFIDLAELNGVHVMCVPPSAGDRIHPLRKYFLPEFRDNYTEELSKWQCENPSESIKSIHLSKLVGRAYTATATVANAEKGFLETGILPYNPHLVVNNFKPEKVEEPVDVSKRWTSPRKRIKKKRWDSSSDYSVVEEGGNPFSSENESMDYGDVKEEANDTEVLIGEDPGAQMPWLQFATNEENDV